MFVLVKLKDTVHVAAANLAEQLDTVVRDSLHAKYANKVLDAHGLGILIYDWEAKNSSLHPLDGGAHVHVVFRLVVFRPSPGEIIVGKVRQCDATGMLVSVNFFDHIYIPASKLQLPSHYDDKENLWVWNFEGHELFLDLQQPIRFRVETVEFADRSGGNPDDDKKKDEEKKEGDASHVNVVAAGTTIADFKPPMRVVASIQEDGLGLTTWWTG